MQHLQKNGGAGEFSAGTATHGYGGSPEAQTRPPPSFRADIFWRCATPGTGNLFRSALLYPRTFQEYLMEIPVEWKRAPQRPRASAEREAVSREAQLQIWHQRSHSGNVE